MKQFIATLAALLVAAAIIFGIKSLVDERARDERENREIEESMRKAQHDVRMDLAGKGVDSDKIDKIFASPTSTPSSRPR